MAPFLRRGDGAVEVRLSRVEADVLRQAAEDLIEQLDADDASFRRLFPPAYDEPDRQQAYAELTTDDLLEGRREAARALVASLSSGIRNRKGWSSVLDLETAEAWLAVLNDLRLVLGTRLDVSEDMDHGPLPAGDPRAPAFNLYLYLGGMQELLLDAMR